MDVIPVDDLVVGGLYRIQARNFSIGVWDGRGFVGPREKFGDVYPFREYPTETGGVVGTAGAFERLDTCPLDDLRVGEATPDGRYFRPNQRLLEWLLDAEEHYT